MEKEYIQEHLSSFTVISRGRVVNIEFDEVTHIRKFGYEVVIYTGKGEYRTRYSLQEIMHYLPVNFFFRVHKSHIVSIKCMNGFKGKKIKVGEFYLQVSAYYMAQLHSAMRKILNESYKTITLHEKGSS